MQTHYDILAISPKACSESSAAFSTRLRKAYRQKCLQHHPDHSSDPNSARQIFAINNAYDILSDEKKRNQYDTELPELIKIDALNQRALNLASIFDSHYSWIGSICQLVQAIRHHVRSAFSFGASDRMIASIADAANKQQSDKLKALLNDFIKSESHWTATSARTLFFDLLMMRRSATDTVDRQQQALRFVTALTLQDFSHPPTDTDETCTGSIESQLQQQAQHITATDVKIAYIQQHLTPKQQHKCPLLLQLLHRKATLIAQNKYMQDTHRYFSTLLQSSECTPAATALLLTLEQLHLRCINAATDEAKAISIAIQTAETELKREQPSCRLFSTCADSDEEEEAKDAVDERRLETESSNFSPSSISNID